MIRAWLAMVAIATAQVRPRVTIGLHEPLVNLSPFAMPSIEGYRATSLLYETLARIDPRTGELEPWLATAWRKTEIGLTVELRANVPTHEGRVLDAGDVVRTFHAFRDPKNNAAGWLPLWQKIDDVRATGPRTVEFVAKDLAYDDAERVLTGLRIQPATGPFAAAAAKDGRVEMTARPTWWNAPVPRFDLVFKAVADETLARQMMAKAQLDFFADVDGDGTRVQGATGVWLDLNLRRFPFDDREVRHALSRLWDRAGMNRRIFGGRWRPALDTFDPHRAGYPKGEADAYAPKRALETLTRAGFVRKGDRLVKNGRPFAFEVLVTTARDARWVSVLQTELAHHGITLEITRVTADAALFARLREGRFDAVASGGGLNLNVDAAAWTSGATYNIAGFSDPAVDRDLERLRRAWSPARRRDLSAQIIRRLRAAYAQLPGLVRDEQTVLVSPRLKISVEAPYDVWCWRLED